MKRLTLILTCFLAISSGCKPPHNNTLTGGGKGGSGILCVTPEHHGAFLDSCSVYIKYASLDVPSNGVYDDSVIYPLPLVSGTPEAVFHNLTSGIYYIYCVGLHPSYNPPNVRGGKGYTLAKEDSEYVIVSTGGY